jgi:hypothetical protein
MKKIALVVLLMVAAACSSYAQTPFNTQDSLTINKLHPTVLVHGDMWWDPVKAVAECPFTGCGESVNFAGAIWMSGYDAGNTLHVAAQTYRQDGNDYWPGPLDATGTLNYTTSLKWNKIWKVNGTDVTAFKALSTHTTANTPESILTWPAKGNSFAQGAGTSALTITDDLAPFVDLNRNGIYEPLLGEYPDFRGDQVLWWIFSDNGPSHNSSDGLPTGVEVHAMAYAYHRGTLIDNVIYYDYTIANKSINNYHNFRFALWDDIDLGYYLDDFMGFDSSRRLGIVYNGTNDDGGGGGHPVNSYGGKPPVTGITMIVLPGDSGTGYIPVGAYDYYNNDASIIGNPATDTEYNNYMRAKMRSGQHFTNDYHGPGIPSNATGTGPATNYVFTGDPADTTQWSECASNNNPGDRRFILSSNDFNFNAGSSQHIVMAQVVTDTADGGGCPNASFAAIRRVSDTAWANYYNPPVAYHKSIPTTTGTVSIYPNPVISQLFIDDSTQIAGATSVTIYNYGGGALHPSFAKSGSHVIIDVADLPPGLYSITYRNGAVQANKLFMKN